MAEEVTAVVTPPAKAEAPKVDPGVQKRIDQMTYKFREQERRAIAAERERDELRAAAAKPKQAPATEVVDKRKTLADFDYDDVAYEDYLAERVESRASKTAAKEAVKAVEEREQTKARETTTAERQAKWKERSEAYAKDHPGFAERVYGDDVPFSDALTDLILDIEIGPQIADYLALPENRDELSRLNKLSPSAAGREIGKLEVKLASTPPEQTSKEETTEEEAEKSASAQEPPKTTKAPPPPPKLQAVASSSTRPATTDPKSDKLSDDEWMKAEQKRVASLRKK